METLWLIFKALLLTTGIILLLFIILSMIKSMFTPKGISRIIEPSEELRKELLKVIKEELEEEENGPVKRDK